VCGSGSRIIHESEKRKTEKLEEILEKLGGDPSAGFQGF
jgi:hypothetical protein